MILLDTNIISEIMKPICEERVVKWQDDFAEEDFFLCAPVLAELR